MLVSDNLSQEVDTADHAFCIFTRAADTCGNPCTDTQQYRIKVILDGFKRHIFANLCVWHDFYAHRSDDVDLVVEDFFWQSVLRNTISQHAAQFWHRIKDGDIVSLLSQEISSGKSHRAATDDSH